MVRRVAIRRLSFNLQENMLELENVWKSFEEPVAGQDKWPKREEWSLGPESRWNYSKSKRTRKQSKAQYKEARTTSKNSRKEESWKVILWIKAEQIFAKQKTTESRYCKENWTIDQNGRSGVLGLQWFNIKVSKYSFIFYHNQSYVGGGWKNGKLSKVEKEEGEKRRHLSSQSSPVAA